MLQWLKQRLRTRGWRGEMGEARQHVSTCMVGVKVPCCTAEGERANYATKQSCIG
jgi:hypothetical protein